MRNKVINAKKMDTYSHRYAIRTSQMDSYLYATREPVTCLYVHTFQYWLLRITSFRAAQGFSSRRRETFRHVLPAGRGNIINWDTALFSLWSKMMFYVSKRSISTGFWPHNRAFGVWGTVGGHCLWWYPTGGVMNLQFHAVCRCTHVWVAVFNVRLVIK